MVRQPLPRHIDNIAPGTLIDVFFPEPGAVPQEAEAKLESVKEEFIDDCLYCPSCSDRNLPGTMYCVRYNTPLQVDLVNWSADDPTLAGATKTFQRGESRALDYLAEQQDPDIEPLGNGSYRAHPGARARANDPSLESQMLFSKVRVALRDRKVRSDEIAYAQDHAEKLFTFYVCCAYCPKLELNCSFLTKSRKTGV